MFLCIGMRFLVHYYFCSCCRYYDYNFCRHGHYYSYYDYGVIAGG